MHTEIVHLASGETVTVEINGKSLDGLHGHAFLLAANREIQVRKIDGAWHEETMSEFEEIHGPSYPYAKHQIGDTIRFSDPESPSGRNSGRVLHVIAPAEKRSCAYIVLPDRVCFPTEIFADEVIEE